MTTTQGQTDHPEIPTGSYCYGVKDGKRFICPHWQGTDAGARCNLLNEEHHTCCPFHLVWDQVKECGINKDDDDDFGDIASMSRVDLVQGLKEAEQAESPKGTPRTVTCPCSRPVEIIDLKQRKDDEPCKLEEIFQKLREKNQ